ncbi:hypothetical protein IQ268_12600 [Oculatella sp. LEGE 06141]|nr:hypothetical protein [Oculatella sp. LEGE 06141]MBE9179402.1 hypothetical protein [Oculatella sp. LEGE 06141]
MMTCSVQQYINAETPETRFGLCQLPHEDPGGSDNVLHVLQSRSSPAV